MKLETSILTSYSPENINSLIWKTESNFFQNKAAQLGTLIEERILGSTTPQISYLSNEIKYFEEFFPINRARRSDGSRLIAARTSFIYRKSLNPDFVEIQQTKQQLAESLNIIVQHIPDFDSEHRYTGITICSTVVQ